jgi:hypothetical protein
VVWQSLTEWHGGLVEFSGMARWSGRGQRNGGGA